MPPTNILDTFAVTPVAPDVVAELLATDDAGKSPRHLTDDEGGSPFRCCLQPSQPGERVALVSYAPLRRWAASTGADPGPYDEVGPIFLHADGCPGTATTTFPKWLRDSPRVFRAYSREGVILDGRLVPANGAFEQAIDRLLAVPGVAVVHARALAFGCFTFDVRRTQQ